MRLLDQRYFIKWYALLINLRFVPMTNICSKKMNLGFATS